MNYEYRIIEGYSAYMNKRWELQRKYFYGLDDDGRPIYKWRMDCCGTKEFCEESLQFRLNRINKGLEPTEYDQRQKEYKERAMQRTYREYELPW